MKMANMSYCQFENTASAMKQCLETLYEAAESGLSYDQFLERLSSDYEKRAIPQMAELLLSLSEVFELLQDNEGLTEEELEELEN
jgi:hypothetical protein